MLKSGLGLLPPQCPPRRQSGSGRAMKILQCKETHQKKKAEAEALEYEAEAEAEAAKFKLPKTKKLP